MFFFSFFFFVVGLLGISFTYKNFFLFLIYFELLFFSLNLNFIFSSLLFDDFFGQIISFLILVLAGCESAIGLAIFVLYSRLRGVLSLDYLSILKG
jgi:NADH-quinone oxidoreductase subunit K